MSEIIGSRGRMIAHHIRFISLAIRTHFKLALALRAAFWISVGLAIAKQLLFLVAWRYFFGRYTLVQGWNFNHMLFMYGTVCFAIGCIKALFLGLQDLPRIIETGELDTFLLQPKNIILNIALSRGNPSAFGEVITGLLLIVHSGYLLRAFPTVLLILIMACFFWFGLLLYLSCLAFFMRNAQDFIRELNLNVVIVATQPNSAYSGVLKFVTCTVLPMALISYFPIEYLRTGLLRYLCIAVFGILVFLAIACWIFHAGLKRYESGNCIAFRQ